MRLMIFTALICLFSALATAEVPFPFVDDFEADDVGGKPSKWEIMMEDPGTSITIVDDAPDADGKCLELQDTGTASDNYELVAVWAGPSPADLIVQYRVMFLEFPPSDNSFFYITTANGQWGESAAAVATTDNGLSHHDGGRWTKFADLDKDTWYSVKYHLRIPDQSFDVYIDDVKMLNEAPFRNTAANADNLRKLWQFSDDASIQHVYMDDIMAYDLENPPPAAAVHPEASISSTWGEIKSVH